MANIMTYREIAQELDQYIRSEYFLKLSDTPPEYPSYTVEEEWDNVNGMFMAMMRRREISTIDPAPRRLEGANTVLQMPVGGRTKDLTDPPVFATGLGFTKQKMKMGLANLSSVKKLSQFLEDSVRMTKETYHVTMLNDADNTSAADELIGFDGLPLCHTAHTLNDSTLTVSNLYGSNSSITYETLDDVITATARLVDEKGQPRPLYRINALWVPPEEETNAYEVLKSRMRPDITNEAANVLGSKQAQALSPASVKVLYYMTADRWFGVDEGHNPLNRYVLEDGGIEGPTEDPLSKNNVWTIEFWIHRCIWAWRGVYMVPIS